MAQTNALQQSTAIIKKIAEKYPNARASRTNLLDMVKLTQENLVVARNLSDAWVNMVEPTLKEKFSREIADLTKKISSKLKGVAGFDTRTSALLPFSTVIDSYIKNVSLLNTQLDKFVAEETFTPDNVPTTVVTIINYCATADIVANFTINYGTVLFAMLDRLSGKQVVIPKYRLAYMDKYLDFVAEAVSAERQRPTDLVRSLNEMMKKHADVPVNQIDPFTIGTIISLSIVAIGSIVAIWKLISFTVEYMLFFLPEKFAAHAIVKYDKIKATREWVATRIALLKLDMAKMDPSSPEYTKLAHIVAAYEEKITDYDQQLNAFEKEYV